MVRMGIEPVPYCISQLSLNQFLININKIFRYSFPYKYYTNADVNLSHYRCCRSSDDLSRALTSSISA